MTKLQPSSSFFGILFTQRGLPQSSQPRTNLLHTPRVEIMTARTSSPSAFYRSSPATAAPCAWLPSRLGQAHPS
eukprot:scaffold2114_cov253-Pinguiococcus_pyrenoidosus.AAC.31